MANALVTSLNTLANGKQNTELYRSNRLKKELIVINQVFSEVT